MPPLVGGENSTVVGITQRSPASGERVGERVQGESVSERRGMSYSCTCHSTLQFVMQNHLRTQTSLLCWYVLHTTNNGTHLVHSETEFIDST